MQKDFAEEKIFQKVLGGYIFFKHLVYELGRIGGT